MLRQGISYIKSPLGIIGLFISFIYSIAGLIMLNNNHQDQLVNPLIWFLIIFPFIVLVVFRDLVVNHTKKIYGPSDFRNEANFLKIIDDTGSQILDWQKDSKVDISKPFQFEKSNLGSFEKIAENANHIEKTLYAINSKSLFNLHNWFNTQNNHSMALLCIDMAVSKGETTSMNFAYRSASLRKLGRINEALYSAELSYQLDSENVDSAYNLAKVYTILGKSDMAHKFVQIVLRSESIDHIDRLNSYLSNLDS